MTYLSNYAKSCIFIVCLVFLKSAFAYMPVHVVMSVKEGGVPVDAKLALKKEQTNCMLGIDVPRNQKITIAPGKTELLRFATDGTGFECSRKDSKLYYTLGSDYVSIVCSLVQGCSCQNSWNGSINDVHCGGEWVHIILN